MLAMFMKCIVSVFPDGHPCVHILFTFFPFLFSFLRSLRSRKATSFIGCWMAMLEFFNKCCLPFPLRPFTGRLIVSLNKKMGILSWFLMILGIIPPCYLIYFISLLGHKMLKRWEELDVRLHCVGSTAVHLPFLTSHVAGKRRSAVENAKSA